MQCFRGFPWGLIGTITSLSGINSKVKDLLYAYGTRAQIIRASLECLLFIKTRLFFFLQPAYTHFVILATFWNDWNDNLWPWTSAHNWSAMNIINYHQSSLDNHLDSLHDLPFTLRSLPCPYSAISLIGWWALLKSMLKWWTLQIVVDSGSEWAICIPTRSCQHIVSILLTISIGHHRPIVWTAPYREAWL